jgi:glycerophosphoryl diester phosphodiesterase
VRWRNPHLPPENTLAAFGYALQQGCDGFEFDVRYTHDRRSILCHDPKLRRKEVAHHEHAFLERRHGSPLPCLGEVLAGFGTTAFLDIELKVTGNEEATVTAVRAHPPHSGFVISSFLPEVLLRLHELGPDLPLGYICKVPEHAPLWAKLPITYFIPHYSLVSRRLVEEVHGRRLNLLTWTINRERDMRRLAHWGVDGLISDNPRLLSETFPSAMTASAK